MIHYTITEHVGGTSKMKTKLKRLFNVTIMTMAVAIAPIASEYCRAVFYEEKKPEGIKKICKR